MSNVIPFRSRATKSSTPTIIIKVVNGESVECVNVDALTPAEFAKIFEDERSSAPQQDGNGALDF